MKPLHLALLLLYSQNAMGDGLAAFKAQPYHADADASITYYREMKDFGGPVVTFVTKQKEFNVDRERLAGFVDILSPLPDNITNANDVQDLRTSLAKVQAFSTKFKKSAPMLKENLASLEQSIKQFEVGQVRFQGAWIDKASYAAIQKKDAQNRAAIEAALQKREGEKEAFAVTQRAKGLELFEGQWLPKNEVANLRKSERENAQIVESIRAKSVLESVYSIIQVCDDGMVIHFHTGKIQQAGVNAEFSYLFGVAKGTSADGDYYKGDLYWCGNYSYINTSGINKTVNAYCLTLNDAIKRLRATSLDPIDGNGDSKTSKSPAESAGIPEVLRGASATGSGFFVGNKGYFVTNAHVVEKAKSIFVLYGGKKLKAELTKISKVADLAVLKTEQSVAGLPISSEDAELGQDVYALGFPLPSIQGLEIKITKGVISSGKGLDDDNTRFQIDAAIQPGNSGGPLCDKSGKLIGVVFATLNANYVAGKTGSIPQNVNYAIKASEVMALLRSKSISFEVSENNDAASGLKHASAAAGLVIIGE